MKNEIGEKYLPIGTVVMLKGGKKRVMITGFCTVTESNKDQMWDYNGCLYPEGMISSKQVLLFDHSQIVEVYHIGLSDEEDEEFKKKLVEVVNKLEKEPKKELKKEPKKEKKNTK